MNLCRAKCLLQKSDTGEDRLNVRHRPQFRANRFSSNFLLSAQCFDCLGRQCFNTRH